MKQTVIIILMCIASSVCFGMLHNQFSARISPEYFTVGHEKLISSTSPTLLGIVWGIHSTWWVGLILGVILCFAARWGRWEKRSAASLLRPLLILFAVCGAAAFTAGLLGNWLVNRGTVRFIEEMAGVIELSRQPGFLAALWMHTASYTVAAMGGLIMAVTVLSGRIRSGTTT